MEDSERKTLNGTGSGPLRTGDGRERCERFRSFTSTFSDGRPQRSADAVANRASSARREPEFV
jgi:hypothetical protein